MAKTEGPKGLAGVPTTILWMDEILHHFETMGKPLFVGIYKGILIPGFLRWCRVSFIHSIIPKVMGVQRSNPAAEDFAGVRDSPSIHSAFFGLSLAPKTRTRTPCVPLVAKPLTSVCVKIGGGGGGALKNPWLLLLGCPCP